MHESRRPTILVIDDDLDAHRLVQLALRPLQARFVAAWDGLEAVAVARKHEPDLIILDYSMPAGDGLTVVRRLRSISALMLTPILVMSARDASTASAMLDAGAEEYLQKPADPAELLATVERLLASSEDNRPSAPGP